MSGYLANLVARSLGQADVIRPRLASLFEPEQAGEGSEIVYPAVPEMVDLRPTPAAHRPMVGPPTARSPEDRPAEWPPPAPRLWEPAVPTASVLQPAFADAEPTSHLPPEMEIAVRTVLPGPKSGPEPLRGGKTSGPIAAPIPGKSQDDERPLRSMTWPPAEAVPKPAIAVVVPPAVVARPHVSPYVAPPSAPAVSEPAPEAAPAPAVRVTIGRVEVRAVLPEVPTPPPSRPFRSGPRLTLEEYLRQRTEGER